MFVPAVWKLYISYGKFTFLIKRLSNVRLYCTFNFNPFTNGTRYSAVALTLTFCHFLVCKPDSSLISINGCHSIKLPTGIPSIILGIILVRSNNPLYKSFIRSRSPSDFQLGLVSLRLSVLIFKPTVKFLLISASILARKLYLEYFRLSNEPTL